VASEVYHHLSDHETTPQHMNHCGVSHWFLRGGDGAVIDLTASQFATTPDYRTSVGKGFCTKNPSRRAQQVIEAVE
jgi:hypothetical protein